MTLVVYGCLASLGIVCSTLLAQSTNSGSNSLPRTGSQNGSAIGVLTNGIGGQGQGDNRPIAAFYGRFSSLNQSDTSIEDQLRLGREKVESMGFHLPSDLEYADRAVSGTKLRREGLDQLLADAKAKKFDLIVVHSLSRLGRESIITMPILKKLIVELEIRFISVAESFDSDSKDWMMLATLYTLQHENYVAELSKNVHRGQEGTILDGHSVGDHRFGYQSVPSPTGEMRGRGRNAKPRMVYQIDAEQAEWVKQIFTWYVEERRTDSWISRELNRRNAPKDHRATTPDWKPDQVVGVLTSRKYIGEWPWGLKRNKRMPSTGQIIQVPRPESETRKWLRQRPDLRLISDDVFFAAQERREKNVEQVAPKRDAAGQLRGPVASRNAHHLLAGLFKCRSCGRLFHTAGAKTKYMACSGYKYTICNCKTMVARQLAQKLILDAVGTVIKSNSAWLQQIVEFTKFEIQSAAKQNPSRLISLSQQLNAVGQKIERLIDRLETTDDPGIEGRLAQRRREKEGLQRELQELHRQQADIPTIPTAEWVELQLRRLDQVLRSGTPAATHALHNLLDGPILMEEIPHEDRQRCHFRGTLRIRIGRLVVERGSEIPEVQAASTGDPDLVQELTIEFREPSKTEEQAAIAWEMHLADRPIKDIAKAMNVSRARMTAILKFAAEERGVEWVDGRARRATLPDSTRPPTLGDQKSEQVMVLFHQDKLLGEIATLLALDRNIVTAVVAKWHRQRGLPVPDGRTRRKRLETKSSPPPTIDLDEDANPPQVITPPE